MRLLTAKRWMTAAAVVLMACGFTATPARSADSHATAGSAKSEKDAAREKWEARITFFGEEDGGWSLRILDRSATEGASIRYTALWKYDRDQKKWVKIDEGALPAQIFPANQKPANSPPDSQVVAQLPIQMGTIGLFYAQWTVNGSIEGATFCRLGPSLVGKSAKEAAAHPLQAQEGFMATVVPINLNTAVYELIPDPRFNTGQPMKKVPTSQPGK